MFFAKRGKPETRDLVDVKSAIRERFDLMVEKTASELVIPREMVAREIFYWIQRHPDPDLRRNPNAREKRVSFMYWGGCQRQGCKDTLELKHAVFHHEQRGIRGQHDPANLKPYHAGCHDREHSVAKGSLSKGSPKKQR